MMQEDSQQTRVVVRGAMDRCCSLWAPILPHKNVLLTGAERMKFDSDDVAVESIDPETFESVKK